ncbi:putative galacturan 1 [Lasiodiplodia hormozganensis]|uniref:galacturonan 1,4-alpha-galacturonidase n=1 Tax=Lasiodiplodia hormozganensis TaxID=869390 RepID=A0AA39U7I5_9PEZI|nr:putative galacturan 1 [Lasiodiplodia hormozganensis]
MEAFDTCGTSGDIIFPEDEQFNISERVHITATDVQIEWRGEWLMSDNLSYWRSNSYPITFQNHRAGIVFSGSGIRINGHGTGGINGNGDTWYSAEAGETQEGRPMPFVLWNVSDVSVEDFYINQSPLWALNIMNGTDLIFRNLVCNATSSEAPSGYNWVQNTDGFDTMDVRNVTLTNFVYQGGDDCIAIKPRSYDVIIQNVTCNGGNGVAIGSVGQYEEDNSVDNVIIDTVKIVSSNVRARFTAYIKTWMGALVPQDSYESAGEPRGGGWGNVTNVVFSNFDIDGASVAPLIDQNSGDNGSYSGTSKMQLQ